MSSRPTYGAIPVTTTATKIIDGNCDRKELIITNATDKIVFIGMDDQVTVDNGTPFYYRQTRGHTKDFGNWLGPIYGIVASGTADVRYWETV